MSELGGEAACWLDLVCDACGGMLDGKPHECRPADRPADPARSTGGRDQAAAASSAGRIASSE